MARSSMAAIASTLHEADAERVSALWEILRSDLGLERVSISPLPHLSYQASNRYDLDLLDQIASDLAGRFRPLRVTTAGLGVFTGDKPVLYIPVVRTPELTRTQVAVWSAASVASQDGVDPYLHPARWIPHITLAQGDLTAELVGPAVERLNREDLVWELELSNLGVIRGRGPDMPQELVAAYPLGGTARNF